MIKMRALSVRQPWAWAIIHAGKDVENRTRRTHYRGPLLIHASNSGFHGDRFVNNCIRIARLNPACMHEMGLPEQWAKNRGHRSRSPQHNFGGIIGQVDLVDCVRDHRSPWAEPELFHLVLANPRPLPFFPCPGRLQLFEVNYPNLEKEHA